MTKWLILGSSLVVFSCSVGGAQERRSVDSVGHNRKVMVVSDLGFCALILREFQDQGPARRELHVFSAPDDVTENNLHRLFALISERYPEPEIIEVWVYTDVAQLGTLATGQSGTAALSREQAGRSSVDQRAPSQLSYYKRMKHVELFRYNPNYPLSGMKTVILRGSE